MTSTPTARSVSTDKAATPTAFPDSGIFSVDQRITLLSTTPGATIYYTVDGSIPTTSSFAFDPYKLPVLEAVNDGTKGMISRYTIKALAVKDGMEASDVATLTYVMERRAKDTYVFRELHPNIYMILDFDDTKMYLIIGSERAMLIDAGLGTGDLRSTIEKMIGDLPLDVVITHGHPDHIAVMGQFQGSYDVYMNHIDIPMVLRFVEQMGYKIDVEQVIDLREGAAFNLGNRKLHVYEVPGHSMGSIVLFDEESGILFAGDAVGSNRPTITDSLWMQFPGMAKIDAYLSTLQAFRPKVSGKLKEILGGHNDLPIYGGTYLDNLQQAAQNLVDNGEASLVPSLRPTDADIWQVVVGDRLTDPNWAAINVSKACLTVPADQIATLSNLQVSGAVLNAGFTPFNFDYTATVDTTVTHVDIIPTTTSTRCQSLTINNVQTKSATPYSAQLETGNNTFVITVTAPDGKATNTYTLIVTKG
jgi:glyoxylase-like metal-dependent hydrolase (beta-lactamase superfamily II)